MLLNLVSATELYSDKNTISIVGTVTNIDEYREPTGYKSRHFTRVHIELDNARSRFSTHPVNCSLKGAFYTPLIPLPSHKNLKSQKRNGKKYFSKTKNIFQNPLTLPRMCAIILYCSGMTRTSGCGAAGSALPWGGRGRKFKSCHSDQFGGS